jgi:hypothetical protein
MGAELNTAEAKETELFLAGRETLARVVGLT